MHVSCVYTYKPASHIAVFHFEILLIEWHSIFYTNRTKQTLGSCMQYVMFMLSGEVREATGDTLV